MRRYFLILFLGCSAICTAQDYDADSVLYTPISKSRSKKITLNQEDKGKLVGYFFTVQTGSLIGCNDCSRGQEVTFSASTSHGVTVGKKFRGALGVGFDSYNSWQALPIFTSVSWDLIGNKNKNAVYIQMNYGWSHPWFIKNGSYNNYLNDPYTDVSGGRMINPSIGYRMKYHDLKLSIGVGYKFQRISYKSASYYYGCPMCDVQVPTQTLGVTQDFNRLQLMMSVGWK
jgi:hypothetical protein